MNKKYVIKFFFALEIVIFSWFYYAGAHGLRTVHELKRENHEIKTQIAQMRKEVDEAEKAITNWCSHDFYKEKIAREELHMAREDEEIYLI